MEYRIGQIFEMDGIWYQFVRDNSNGCNSCVFHTSGCKCVNPVEGVRCGSWERLDETDGHFVRLLPLEDEYDQGGDKWQQYKCIEKPNTEDKRVYIAHTDSEVGLIVSIRLTSSNDMKSEMEEIKNENLSNTENIGKNLKPFDLQAAKAGKPVCTRDGRKARIICFDRTGKFPIVALVEAKDRDDIYSYLNCGKDNESVEKEYDLMMLHEKREAIQYAQNNDNYITTIKISWKE